MPIIDNLVVAGRTLTVTMRNSTTARRMSLRVDPATETLILVLPQGVSAREALKFALSKSEWIGARLHALPPRITWADGASIPLLGIEHRIHHAPEAKRGVWVDGSVIHVSGQIEHLPRRVSDWLKREAHRHISSRALAFAVRLGRPVGRITIRDTRSRWGSCNATGDLSFSWRLVLAPADVIDYVVAHETAHLVELNHSLAFWRVVGGLVNNVAEARVWLRRHGTALHRYG